MRKKISAKAFLFFDSLTKHHFTRYIIVGGLSAVLELGTLVLLVEVFKMGYLQGNVIAFFLIQVLNYVLSRKWVFQSSGNKKRIEFPVFMFFVACGFIINQVGLWFFADIVGIYYEIAKVIAITLVVIWNFFTRRFIVFKKISSGSVLPSRKE